MLRRLRGGASCRRAEARTERLDRGDAGELIERNRLEVGFQKDFGFAQAGAEIISGGHQESSSNRRDHGQARRDIAGGVLKLTFEVLDRFGKNPQLVKKPRSAAEKHVMKDSIPGSGALSCIAAKEFRFKGPQQEAGGRHDREQKESHKMKSGGREAIQEIGGDRNLLAGADKLATRAQRKSIVERDAHHRIRAFPSANDRLKDYVFPRGRAIIQSSDTLPCTKSLGRHPRDKTAPKKASGVYHLLQVRTVGRPSACRLCTCGARVRLDCGVLKPVFLTLGEGDHYTAARLSVYVLPLLKGTFLWNLNLLTSSRSAARN